MKIFYAVQATGNGHISRAIQLLPYLKQWGSVDIFLSGANASLTTALPVAYRSKGISLYYGASGGLDYGRMLCQNSLLRARKEARDLPLKKYDVVINDFEFITAMACRMQNIPSVQFGHQASFKSPLTPRPAKRQWLGEVVLQNYAPATQYIGLHFQPYDHFIFPPVIKEVFLKSEPQNKGHITVYLPAYSRATLVPVLQQLPDVHFHLFLKEVKEAGQEGNISFFPVSETQFNDSLLHCAGIITGAGFETPAEALYMGKRLLCIPIRGQYEQYCNLAALEQLGVRGLRHEALQQWVPAIQQWLQQPPNLYRQAVNDVPATLAYLMQNYPGTP